MIGRSLRREDIARVQEIHERYYKEEFNFPNFLRNFLCAFVVPNDKGDIISAGGVRLIAESVIITNKGFSPKERREALLQVLETSKFICKREGYDGLHAFVQEEAWAHILKSKYNFYPCAGEALVIDL